MLDVCLLGSGGMMPLPGRWLTSLLLRYNGKMILVDCGEGTQIPLKLAGWGFKAIDAIFFTHYHADHIAGLPGLLLTIGNSGKETPLDLIGPPGLLWVVKSLLAICPALSYDIRAVELTAKPAGLKREGDSDDRRAEAVAAEAIAADSAAVEDSAAAVAAGSAAADSTASAAAAELTPHSDIELFENLSFQYALCDHNATCYAYSFSIRRQGVFNPERAKELNIPLREWKKLQMGESAAMQDGRIIGPDMVLGPARRGIKLSYCTDSRPTPELRTLFNRSDLLICEGMYGEDSEKENARGKKHMVFSEAAGLARDADVGELWLTHYSPSLQNPSEYIGATRRVFAKTYAGRDLMKKTLMFID